MNEMSSLRRECAQKRDEYHHAKAIYGSALSLGLQAVSDLTALRDELEASLVAYYAAHSALHTALKTPVTPALN